MNTPLKTITAVTALSLAPLAVLAGDKYPDKLADVSSVYIESPDCAERVGAAINERFEDSSLSWSKDKDAADSILVLSVTELGSEISPATTNIGGGLNPVSVYQAMIRGAGDKTLFETTGKVNSVNREEMCADIGLDIARQLETERH